MERGDRAVAKAAGRGKPAKAQAGAARRRSRLPSPTAVSGALAEGSLRVAFQPIATRMPDGTWRVTSVEALLRPPPGAGAAWETQRMVDALAAAGRSRHLFQFVLARALAAARRWADGGRAFNVAVNVPVDCVASPALAADVRDGLLLAGVPAARLALEVTEREPLADLHAAAAGLARVRELGVRISLDDFGTGFSTSERLDCLCCDEIKVDRSLVAPLPAYAEPRLRLERMVALARARGLSVCAEGVEDEAVLRAVSALDVDRIQGWLLGAACTEDALPLAVTLWERRSASCTGDTVLQRVHARAPVHAAAQPITVTTTAAQEALRHPSTRSPDLPGNDALLITH